MKIATHIYKSLTAKLIAASLLLFALEACDPKNTEPVDVYGYFPLEIGRYTVYNVKEEIYSTGQANPVIKNWQEKDKVESVSDDEAGVFTYIVSRSTRSSETEYWTKIKEYKVQKYPDKILTNIDNQTFFSMAFPVDTKMTWNGNTYNNRDEEEYHYENVNVPGKVGAESFDRTLRVVERNDSSIINRYIGIKQYGLGVGLLSDNQTSFEYCQDDACIGSGKIDSGTRKARVIVDYGIE
ncbi:hypothetical protein DYBT9623_02697 [Dyadobacter sp. CECT 9623]|uniref:Lipoprotein n=1 Tax=Dyadobacter linearis TaxID=2823330 RepID=A0ABM8UR00_9BACT|nr:hypothetical protein [Dyadobacter sp. CECT 9623]CAG5069957.1 hypothetical protein DYBT9623_02697 [Dyadobacter sp. CECT 9623]